MPRHKHHHHHHKHHKGGGKSTVGGDAKVKVAVRVRPLSTKERKVDKEPCVMMQDTQTVLHNPKTEKRKVFNFDHSFWSVNREDDHFSGQSEVFEALGREVLENAFQGYNACIFAYGQTGSGKTYTMMGPQANAADEELGIIPRLCHSIFGRIRDNDNPNLKYKVDVSYMEIYNEKVQDLLNPSKRGNLRLREHKILGPYVEGLSKLAVNSFDHIKSLMDQGNKVRHTAETQMNRESSRSHAVFTITVTQATYFEATKTTGEKVSRISLVDLAGSERHGKTGTTGMRLVEGSSINKSLTTLGLVISALADSSASGKRKFIPYRDSTLTYLLKDNLGGNSRTVMVANISPSTFNFEESLSTLRYADRAKRIVNHAVVNEDPNAKVIRELQEELERLRAEVGTYSKSDTEELLATKARLKETEALIDELNMSWEEKLKATENLLEERRKMLDEHAASIQSTGNHALRLESRLPHFISLSDDPFSSNITIYTFKEGITRIGREPRRRTNLNASGAADDLSNAAGEDVAEEPGEFGDLDDEYEDSEDDDETPPQDIHIYGLGTEREHAIIEFKVEHEEDINSLVEVVVLHPIAEECFVDGVKQEDSVRLRQGNVIQLGQTNIFRFNHPTEAARLRKQKGGARGAVGMKAAASLLSMFGTPVSTGAQTQQQKQHKQQQQQQQQQQQDQSVEEAERERQRQEEARLRREREEQEKEELRRREESLANERAMLQAEKERVARERQRLEDERRAQEQARMEQEEQLRREAQLREEQRQMELEREIKARAEREAREEMEKQMQETEALRRKVEEMSAQLQESNEHKERELIARERQRLLAETKASQQDIEARARREAALALEEEKKRQDEELAKAREEIQRLTALHAEETTVRRQEAEQRLAAASKEIGEKNDLVRQLKEQLEEMQRQRDEESAEAERALRAELKTKEEEQAKLLQQAREQENKLLDQIAEREAKVRAEIEEQAQADKATTELVHKLQEESRAREAESREHAQRKLDELTARLDRERAEFEKERRRRQEAEARAAREKWERDIDEAYNLKMLEEERMEAERKFKRNMQAKEAWMKHLEEQRSVEEKLKEETARLADATNRRNEAAKDLAKADIQLQQSRRQSLLLEHDMEMLADSDAEEEEEEEEEGDDEDAFETPSGGSSGSSGRAGGAHTTKRKGSRRVSNLGPLDEERAVGGSGAASAVAHDDGDEAADSSDDEDVIDITTPSSRASTTSAPAGSAAARAAVGSASAGRGGGSGSGSDGDDIGRGTSATSPLSQRLSVSTDGDAGRGSPMANNPFLDPYVSKYGAAPASPHNRRSAPTSTAATPGPTGGTDGSKNRGWQRAQTAPQSKRASTEESSLGSPRPRLRSKASATSLVTSKDPTKIANNPFLDPSMSSTQTTGDSDTTPVPPPRLNSVGAMDMANIRAQVEARSKAAAHRAKQRRQQQQQQQQQQGGSGAAEGWDAPPFQEHNQRQQELTPAEQRQLRRAQQLQAKGQQSSLPRQQQQQQHKGPRQLKARVQPAAGQTRQQQRPQQPRAGGGRAGEKNTPIPSAASSSSSLGGAATSSKDVTMAHAFMKIMKAQEEWTRAKARQKKRAEHKQEKRKKHLLDEYEHGGQKKHGLRIGLKSKHSGSKA